MDAQGGTAYRNRLVDGLLDACLTRIPALNVTGPRATGKTTTITRRAASVVRLDRKAEAAAFEADPDAALRGLAEPVLLDEWQAVPGVLGAVKRAVDADPRPNRFYVTGSVRAELENPVWAGTGRLVRLALHPMTVRERLGRVDGATIIDRLAADAQLTVPEDSPDLRGHLDLALQSGFPVAALLLDARTRQAWLEGYLEDLLTRDVEQLERPRTKRRDAGRLRRYLEAYALNSAGVTDHETISRAAQVNKATAAAYETLLEDLLVAERVPAWRSNRLKRLVQRPKRYLIDPALITTALRLDIDGVIRDGSVLGRVIETFVAAQLRPELALSANRPRLHHLRTGQGRHEIDLLIEFGDGRLIGFEVKVSAAPSKDDAKHLAWLRDELPDRFLAGVVLHTGPRVYELDRQIIAAPISAFWS